MQDFSFKIIDISNLSKNQPFMKKSQDTNRVNKGSSQKKKKKTKKDKIAKSKVNIQGNCCPIQPFSHNQDFINFQKI
jgi:hypothetical protein